MNQPWERPGQILTNPGLELSFISNASFHINYTYNHTHTPQNRSLSHCQFGAIYHTLCFFNFKELFREIR